MTTLTYHFTLEEFIASSTALRLQINNAPEAQPNGAEIRAHLQATAEGLELVRSLLHGLPIHIDSGYRCPALNRAVNGARTSAHMDGFAVDFICPGYGTPAQIVDAIAASSIVFDQLIEEGTWVHVSFDPKARHQVLNAHFSPNGTSYTPRAA